MICPRCSGSNPADQLFCGQCGNRLSETVSGYDTTQRLGQVLDGKYRLRSLVGIGSSGAVYRAERQGLGHTVAVKVLHPHVSADPQARMRLENEARLTSQIDHPNVVSILDFHVTPELTYLVMEFLSGISLDEVLAEIGHLGLRRSIHIARQLLAALEASHSFGVLHRDLKPDNVYLTLRQDELDFVKVVDFGMARLKHVPATSRITIDGNVCGTPGYMAPEQARNSELTERSDLYAVGVILYECLTGNNPFIGPSAVDTMVNQIQMHPELPSTAGPAREIPLYLDAIVMRALSKNPDQRFKSAREFREVLEELAIARTRSPEEQSGPARACAECGHVGSASIERCEACGAPRKQPVKARERAITPLSPEQMGSFSVEEPTDVDPREFELSPTTSIRAYRAVAWDFALVGRDQEILRGQAALENPGPPYALSFLRVTGPPGIGKWRVARELVKGVAESGARVCEIHPPSIAAAAGLQSVRRAALELLGLTGQVLDLARLLSRASDLGFDMDKAQGLAELCGVTTESADPAEDRRLRRALAWRALVRAVSRDRPLLLAFYNLQRFDAPTQELVASLISRKPQDQSITVVVTHDTGLRLPWPPTEQLALQPLSFEAARALAAGLREKHGIKADPDALVDASGGVPLLLIELARLAAIDPRIPPPRSLAEAINQRINRLPPSTRLTLHGISVLGCLATPQKAAQLLEQDEKDTHHTLTFLAAQGFLTTEPGGFYPAHQMHAQVAHASTPVALRTRLHQRSALLEQAEPTPSAAVIGYHLFEGREYHKAIPYLLEAGGRALYDLDDDVAKLLFSRVLHLLGAPDPSRSTARGPWLHATLGLATSYVNSDEIATALMLLKQATQAANDVAWQHEKASCEALLTTVRRRRSQLVNR